MDLITSTRMYDVAPAARAAWQAVLAAAHARAGLRVRTIAHAWPQPIGELWGRPGLCGAFMCGWPYARARRDGLAYQAVAGVVPDWPAYGGQARYRSAFLVHADSPWRTLADSAGSRYGWMVRDSQSGWNAPRAALAPLAAARGAPLFSRSLGPYGNPRGLLGALAAREIDIAAVDDWYLDLLREHDPAALAGLRTLAHTPWTPNPLLVAGPDVDPPVAARLGAMLCAMHDDPAAQPLLAAAHVARFVPVRPESYDILLELESSPALRGYDEIR